MNVALILAGGTGSRIGEEIPKQFIEVGNRPVFCYCLDICAAHTSIDAIQMVADESWHEYIRSWMADDDLRRKWKGFSKPGINRQLSILSGLEDIRGYASEQDLVMIHDAARPFLTANMIDDYFREMTGHDGVLPVLQMKDTVYFSSDGKSVSDLLDRGCIFAGQAPEIFRLGRYYDANTALLPERILRINGAAEPAIIAGMDIVMVTGDESNYKITTQADLQHFRQKVEGMRQ